ncbi:hypothetical protein GPECTOR_54g245 [Gonium pectorale]|uniref:Uncharacterized protein n=1 Tax=Gonium pectorale TaxID=33097 RepID=A0A150G6V6_GONPE|nr:hypothetical protein GPECTOR_54g245 [Gonium pectorale]|eukprot:KXZ45503.1 hypothetical protein GPECTOR_54g245 [Gonium pectorale]
MAAAAPLNHGQLVQLLLEYGQRVRDIQERAWVYSHPSYVEKGLPLLYSAAQQFPQLHQGGAGADAKGQKTISQNFLSIGQLLSELHRVLGSLTLRSYPDLLHQYMDMFCGAVKAGLLLDAVPRRAAAQVAHVACAHLDKATATPLLATIQDAIFSAPTMVAYLQHLFRAIMPRIAQILELVVGPALSVSDNCDEVASAGLLVMSSALDHVTAGMDPGVMPGSIVHSHAESSPAMGMYGMTRSQVYPFLRHRETIRQWGLFGFLIFPEVLRQVGASQRLTMLLADGFALHIYKDRVASRKSQSDEGEAHDPQSIHPLLVDAACAAARAAPVQHRMWRAYLTGELRNMHASCQMCPSRIQGQMEMVLAALSLAREELLWFARHVSRNVPTELVPILSARGLLESGRLQAVTLSDGLQVEHHSTLSKQIKEAIGAELMSHVVPCTPRVEFRLKQAAVQIAAGMASPASTAGGVQPFKDLTDLLRSVLSPSTPPSDAQGRVSSACGIWLYVGLQLASVDPPLKEAKVLQYAEDTRYLEVLQKGLDAARMLYERSLLHAAATDLAPGLQYVVEPLLAAAQRALGSGCTEDMQAAMGAMQTQPEDLPRRCMDMVVQCIRQLFAPIVQVGKAADLATRMLPLALALDNGRSQLVESVRDNFANLLNNTAAAVGQVSTPLPSVQLAPIRRFVEVVSMLQPQLATELLPELGRLMLQQASAPTIQPAPSVRNGSDERRLGVAYDTEAGGFSAEGSIGAASALSGLAAATSVRELALCFELANGGTRNIEMGFGGCLIPDRTDPLLAMHLAVALSHALQTAMSQVLHPAAGQFLLGCDSPAAAMLCAYQRVAQSVAQAVAATAGNEASAAGQQHALACMERLPLLKAYSYAPLPADAAVGNGVLEEHCSLDGTDAPAAEGAEWLARTGAAAINTGALQRKPLPEPEGTEPSLEDGRWACELDTWRPAARVLPLVMGAIG